MGVRIPFGNHGASVDLVTFLHGNHGTVRQLVALALTTEVVRHGQLAGTRHGHQRAIGTLDVLQVMQADGTAVLHQHVVDGRGTARRTADVERTHGELSTRLTDRLGSDNADRLADVDLMPAGQIAPVALGTDAVAGFTGDRRAHDHFVDAVQLDEVHPLLVDQRTRWDQHVISARLEHVTCDHTTQYALTERLNHIATFDMRRHVQALLGAAIDFGNYQILRDVDQTTRQVTGVRGLQSGIRQTLTSTVRGDEVLQYVQTLTEVRGDRRLDDGAVRLGHQATHTGELANLSRGTPRTGVGHHVHRVERVLLGLVAFTVDDLLFREVGHHRLGDFVVGLGPEVDHLVVLLALGN